MKTKMNRILIVDDDPDICLAMSEVLRAKDFYVDVSENGEEALKQMQIHAFDLVLLDIFMPEMDGFETIGAIRKCHEGIKIIAMTGYDKQEFDPLTFARSLGADDALTKPFSADDLAISIKKLLG